MQDIIITIEKLNKLFELHDKYTKSKEEASNELSNAKMNTHRRIKYKGENLEEGVLWDEIRYGGINCEAGNIMKSKYPKVFETAEKQNEIAKEFGEFCLVELGIDYTAVKLSDIIRLCLGLIDYKLKENIK